MKKNIELKVISVVLLIFFACFLIFPMLLLLTKSFQQAGGITLANYLSVITEKGFGRVIGNSFLISAISASLATVLSFGMAYTINFTNAPKFYKKVIALVTTLPMLLPTVTYGFAIIYSFGKQGLITKIIGHQFFEIYGPAGCLIGYLIYTLPISFVLMNNSIKYIDKKYMIVSRVMGDSLGKAFLNTILRPLVGTFATSFIQCFFLTFTDYGIPASVGGDFEVIASRLYSDMLGSVQNFNRGAVIAVVMLVPSIFSVLLLKYLEKYNIRYSKISTMEFTKNRVRDVLWSIYAALTGLLILAIFAVIFIVPMVRGWPYDLTFTFDHIAVVISDKQLTHVYVNSLLVSFGTAVVGVVLTYAMSLLVERSKLTRKIVGGLEVLSLVTNTIPGMVLGIAYMLAFKGTFLQNTLQIIILCNIIHFFSTPYLMLKNCLSKMNNSWETTAKLMGDTWIKTVRRIITPNAAAALLETFSYLFVNSMVTISAVIFLAGSRTMVITTKIQELQHFTKFNEIFVLSIFMLLTNIITKAMIQWLVKGKH